MATNEDEPELTRRIEDFKDTSWMGNGNFEIGKPVGCPKCKAWGVGEFEEV